MDAACLGSLGFLALIVIAVLVWREIQDLAGRIRVHQSAHEDVLRRLTVLERRVSQPPPSPPPVEAAPAPAPAPTPALAPVPPPAPAAPPPVVVTAPAPVPSVVRAPEPPPPPTTVPPKAAPPPEPPPRPTPPPPPPPRPQAPAWTAPPPPPPRKPFDWESLVGVKLFSWIAGILFALTVIPFLRYSVEHGWLTPPIRMAFGLVMGAGLLVGCELSQARRYAITANALGAAGIVALFSTFFAAHTLWHLLGAGPTFFLMVLVTAVALSLSIRHNALFISLLGLVGGFATPSLLSSGEDPPFGLFGYLLLLNAGLAWVALRKSWPVLSVLSLAFTFFYQWGWVFKFLDAGKVSLALGIFLIFPLLGFLVPAVVRGPEEGRDLFARTAVVGALLPLFFGLYLAAVPAYGARYGLLFGFLFVLQAGLFALAVYRGPTSLHSVAAGGTLLAFVIWFVGSYEKAGAWPALLGFVALFLLFDLAAPWLAERLDPPLGRDGRA